MYLEEKIQIVIKINAFRIIVSLRTDDTAEFFIRLCHQINMLRALTVCLSRLCGGVRSAGGGVVEEFVKVDDFAVRNRYDMREIRRILFISRFRAG